MEKRNLERIKLSLLKQIDLLVWRSYHQTLVEMINELRVHRLNLPLKPSVDEIFGTLRKERMLEFSTQPGMKELRDAVDRMVEGTFGLCQHCGQEMEEKTLEQQPTIRYCRACSVEMADAVATQSQPTDNVPFWSTHN
jgi:hypothetical protein